MDLNYKVTSLIFCHFWRSIRDRRSKFVLYIYIIIYLSDFVKTWPLGFRSPAPGQSGAQNYGVLDVLVGTAG